MTTFVVYDEYNNKQFEFPDLQKAFLKAEEIVEDAWHLDGVRLEINRNSRLILSVEEE